MEEIDTVDEFKAKVKELLKACKYKAAIEFVNIKYESDVFANLPLRELVTLVHWWTKVFYKACDLRSMTAKCLTKVNTMINAILTSGSTTFKHKDGLTYMT